MQIYSHHNLDVVKHIEGALIGYIALIQKDEVHAGWETAKKTLDPPLASSQNREEGQGLCLRTPASLGFPGNSPIPRLKFILWV